MPYTNDTKPTTSFTNDTKPSGNFTNDTEPQEGGYLLKEDAFYLLLETGDYIILNNNVIYSNDSKP